MYFSFGQGQISSEKFLLTSVLTIILLDSECRKRKVKRKIKPNAELHVAKEVPEITNWKDIEVGTPMAPPITPAQNVHRFEEDDLDSVDTESPLDLSHINEEDLPSPEPGSTRPLSDMLIGRLEEINNADEAQGRESPLDYGYEGGDDSIAAPAATEPQDSEHHSH
ncbi:unnamed protein product [Echinostoma caproni]|uniref:Uncharacterized protein n=1 Tax=Echinostoma caproni TaxID=27848 RepID=A0A183A960_9TREM|nr:unnamed protein product [Echinostoma caproni]